MALGVARDIRAIAGAMASAMASAMAEGIGSRGSQAKPSHYLVSHLGLINSKTNLVSHQNPGHGLALGC